MGGGELSALQAKRTEGFSPGYRPWSDTGARVPRYFFDINNGHATRDDVGVECSDPQAAVIHAKRALPEIAVEEVPRDGERQTLTVLISDEDGRAVYVGSLTFTGMWLDR